MRKKQSQGFWIKIIIAGCLSLALVFSMSFLIFLKQKKAILSLAVTDEPASQQTLVQDQSISLLAVGDIMYHSTQIKKTNGAYDFEDNFKYVADQITAADVAVANFESTTTTAYAYSGYPAFNTPIEAVTAIKNAGFDVVSTVNNHAIDSGKVGIIDTIDAFADAGIQTVGTQKEASDGIVYREVKGIKLAFLAYSYGFNGLEGYLSDEDLATMVNTIDETRIQSDITKTKSAGADFTIVFIHWGQEYRTSPTEYQEELGLKMLEWGANVVLGSHPHVVERAESVEIDGEKRFIIYSLGNFISDQRLESVDDINTERGAMIQLTLTKRGATNTVSSVSYFPTWVNKYQCPGRACYEVIPTKDVVEGTLALDVTQASMMRIKNAYYETLERLRGN